MKSRKIIHIDMDAFYASVEQKENPRLKHKAVIVGGNKHYGIVTTCSYEARAYGVKSAMPIKKALTLCPHAIVLTPRKELYSKVSKEIMNIFKKYTDLVEPLALDEAYLDVTENKLNMSSATKLAQIIQKDILDNIGITCSCGVSYNKFLAKSASDVNKPFGIFVITPKIALNYLESLSINKFYGIGRKTTKKMVSLGIYSGSDLKDWSKEDLKKYFKNQGTFYYNIVRGIDNREVIANRPTQSIGNETTLVKPIIYDEDVYDLFYKVFNKSYHRMLRSNLFPKTITIKIKYENNKAITRSKSMNFFTNKEDILYNIAKDILKKIEYETRIKLLGVSFSNFSNEENYEEYKNKEEIKQLSLF